MKICNMTEGRPVRLMLSVAFPLMLGNVFQQLYTLVDAQIVGRVEGLSALAALGASDWFNWMFLTLVQGAAQGFSIPMAQAFGADDEKKLRHYIGNSVSLAALIAIIITVLSLILIRPILSLLHTPEEILPISIGYLQVLFSGLGIVMAYNLLAGILRALGDGQTPLQAMVIAALSNVGMDLLFVAVFHWGVVGAAAATVLAQGISVVFCLLRLRGLPLVHPTREDFKPDLAVWRELLLLGCPIAVQNGMVNLGGMIMQRIVNVYGVTFIAGYTATIKLYGILEAAGFSYGFAVSTYCSQNLGAGKLRRIQKGTHLAALVGVATSMLIAAFMFCFGKAVAGSFITGEPAQSAQSLRYAVEFLHLMCWFLPILYLLHIYRSALQGLGRTFAPMLSGFAELLMRIFASQILPPRIGYYGIFWAEICAWAGSVLLLVVSYYYVIGQLRKTFLDK